MNKNGQIQISKKYIRLDWAFEKKINGWNSLLAGVFTLPGVLIRGWCYSNSEIHSSVIPGVIKSHNYQLTTT